MTALEELLARQAEGLEQLQEAEVVALLQALEDARREMAEVMEAPSLLARQAQVDAALVSLRRRLEGALGAAVTAAQEVALAQLLGVLGAFEPGLAITALELDALARIAAAESTLTWRYSLERYGADLAREVHQALLVGSLRGEEPAVTARRISGVSGSVLSGMRPRAELIVRMEMGRAHDAAFQASMEATEDAIGETSDPVMVRADETRDAKNHPLSRVLDGRTRTVRGVWRVPVALVVAEAARLKRDTRGIFWPIQGGDYVGRAYPAHFHDRGRGTPWRASWSESKGLGAAPKSRGSKGRGRPGGPLPSGVLVINRDVLLRHRADLEEVEGALRELPPDLSRAMARRGFQVRVAGNLADIDPALALQEAAGRPGENWGAVGAMSVGEYARIAVGVSRTPFESLHRDVLEETAHAWDYIAGQALGLERLSHSSWWADEWSKAITDGRLARFSSATLIELEYLLGSHDSDGPAEFMANLLAEAWGSQEGRAMVESLYPGLITTLENKMRSAIGLHLPRAGTP